MTKCDRCGKEVGALFCGKCREEIKRQRGIPEFTPVLYYDRTTRMYLVACTVLECPCNDRGICSSKISLETFKSMAHEWDGDNCIKQVCG